MVVSPVSYSAQQGQRTFGTFREEKPVQVKELTPTEQPEEEPKKDQEISSETQSTLQETQEDNQQNQLKPQPAVKATTTHGFFAFVAYCFLSELNGIRVDTVFDPRYTGRFRACRSPRLPGVFPL